MYRIIQMLILGYDLPNERLAFIKVKCAEESLEQRIRIMRWLALSLEVCMQRHIRAYNTPVNEVP